MISLRIATRQLLHTRGVTAAVVLTLGLGIGANTAVFSLVNDVLLRILMAVVLLVLIAACPNVANLLLARAAARHRDIAVRLALGAVPSQIPRMILGEALVLAAAGLAAGVVVALSASRFISAMLFGLSPIDPLTYGAVAIVLAAAALLASSLPARRAAHVDPMTALRSE